MEAERRNVLITSVGRRNLLLRYFRAALRGSGRLIAADMSRTAPALLEADVAELVPPVSAPGYIDEVLGICRRHSVGMVLSLNDLELPLLAGAKRQFEAEGILALVPEPEIVDLCFDKWRMFNQFRAWAIPTPQTYCRLDDALGAIRSEQLHFPVIVKPRWGTASIAVEVASDVEELKLVYALTERRIQRSIIANVPPAGVVGEGTVLIQERIDGEEYGLDIVNNLQGDFAAVLARRKLAMRAGETDKAITVEESVLTEVGLRIAKRTRHPGIMDCDVFLTRGGPTVLELNARFGGGYPFSQIGGADVPRGLVRWLQGKSASDAFTLRPGILAAKTDGILRVNLEE